MAGKPKRAVVIGLDAPTVEDIERFANSGDMPNVRRLIERGVIAENCLVPHSTITPPNWTTIATGAWPGTHGITCFHFHEPNKVHVEMEQAFDSRRCKAEFIWEAAERVGAKSIIINYPSTWPPRVREGVQLFGMGLAPNEWRIGLPKYIIRVSVWGAQVFATEEALKEPLDKRPFPFMTAEAPEATIVKVTRPEGWRNLPEGAEWAVELPLWHRRALHEVKEPKVLHALILKEGDGFKVVLCKERDLKTKIGEARAGEWSPILRLSADTSDGRKEGVFRFKPIEVYPQEGVLRLYLSPLCQVDGWSYPDHIAREIPTTKGIPLPASETFEAFFRGWIDMETFIEEVDLHHAWLAEASSHLMRNVEGWRLFFMHAHCPDWMYHALMKRSDPTCNPDEEDRKFAREIIRRLYSSLDRMIGEIVGAAGEEALVIIVSDHGALPSPKGGVPFLQILKEAGLLVTREDPETGEEVVDWSRTKAYWQREVHFYVNLKGREPQGIVDPKDYERVRDEIIEALMNWRDPKTGERPVYLALKREDMRSWGAYGDEVGDVMVAVKPGWG
ncbi:MAG TPA: hypothetical protein EYP65_06860, partial [Armatimonadetes bacterium]|nr:hypothetical protein [Armatimonadota bacterium]